MELRQAGHRGGTSVAHTPSSAPGRGAGHRSAASRSGPLGFSSFPGATSARGGGGDAVGVALGCWGCRRLPDVRRLARGPRPPWEAKVRAQGLPCGAESWKPRIHCAQTAPPPPHVPASGHSGAQACTAVCTRQGRAEPRYP